MLTVNFTSNATNYEGTTYWNSPIAGIEILPYDAKLNYIMADGEELEEIKQLVSNVMLATNPAYEDMQATWIGDVAHTILYILQNSRYE